MVRPHHPKDSVLCAYQCDRTPWQNVASRRRGCAHWYVGNC